MRMRHFHECITKHHSCKSSGKTYPFLVFHTASVPTHLQFCLVATSQVQVLVLECQWCVAKLRHLQDSQVTLQLE
jgi:hypothetical protein